MGMRRCCHDAPVRDVSLQRASDLAREHAARTEPEDVPVGSAAGRRLAAAVTARADLPSEDASAMDGCAVRAADTPGALALAGESAAGAPLAAPPTGRGGCMCSRDAPCGDMQLDVRPHRDDPAG
jgi:molybdopterin biosynthesis enzyme